MDESLLIREVMRTYGLCIEENNETQDYMEGNTRWVVTLNDGVRVYCYDGKITEGSDWIKLRNYCNDMDRYITDMHIHFRSNTVSLPSNKEGYFFRRSVLGGFGMEVCEEFMLIGYIENGKVLVKKYRVPEMLLQYNETREIEDCGESLITKEKSNVFSNLANS